jgi:3-oxoacyl-(acyl-carrier-protein) synthase
MPKLTREEVRKIVDEEAKFSEKWDRERPDGSPGDADKSVETWLAWMQVYLQEAMKAATLGYDKTAALHNLRCVLNLGEACATYHGLPRREEGDTTDLYSSR